MHHLVLYLLYLINAGLNAQPDCFSCSNAPEGTIFCDDFENKEDLRERYFAYDDDDGDFILMENAGRNGSAGMRVRWQKGEVDAGKLHKAIGRSPDPYMSHAAMPDKDFDEIYWRMDIKFEPNWQGGGGDKLSRATVIAGRNWQQSMIAHIWSGGRVADHNYLVMDPASGINDKGELVTQRYNDFRNLRWLGNKRGVNDIFSDVKAGKWYCIVAHVKLNTPGKSDGIFEFWIDDVLQAGSYDLNWHGDWNNKPGSYKINAIFFENYWNKGAVKDQERYFDNIVISTQPIPCNCK
ncbi:MAG: hypothetical protein QM668_19195 [Agriterribacter sp.]